MPMTPREIVLANIKHETPDRPGLTFSRGRINDFLGCGIGPSRTWTQKKWTEGEYEYHDDAWGNIWFRIVGKSQGGEIFKPALEDWSQLETMTLPDFDDPERFAPARDTFSRPEQKYKSFFLPGWVFATSRYLRKMEVYFSDLIEYREEIDRLHDKVTGLFERVIRLAADAGAEGIFFCEDLGIQDRPLIGPAMFRDILKPHYKRLCDAAHECGMTVIQHSCGYNWELLDDLIDAGIDCFQFDQPAAYDFAALSEKLRANKVGLYSPVDIQKIMPTGDRDLIEREATRMVETFRGGLLCKDYPDLHGIGVETEWDDWAYDAILRASGLDPVEYPPTT